MDALHFLRGQNAPAAFPFAETNNIFGGIVTADFFLDQMRENFREAGNDFIFGGVPDPQGK
jgi:hypothetical protein